MFNSYVGLPEGKFNKDGSTCYWSSLFWDHIYFRGPIVGEVGITPRTVVFMGKTMPFLPPMTGKGKRTTYLW